MQLTWLPTQWGCPKVEVNDGSCVNRNSAGCAVKEKHGRVTLLSLKITRKESFIIACTIYHSQEKLQKSKTGWVLNLCLVTAA